MPADFDQESYGAVGQRLSPYSEAPAFSGYASGFNGLAFRFAAADEAHERLAAAFTGEKAFLSQRYEQEEALFAFFVTAISALECLFFSIYHVGACLGSRRFAIATEKELSRVCIPSTRAAYQSAFPGEPLTNELEDVAQSPEVAGLKEYRDYLTHRGSMKRRHVVSVGPDRRVDMSAITSATVARNPKSVPSSWMSTLKLTPTMTAEPRRWLGIAVSRLLKAEVVFLDHHSSRTG